MEPILNLEDVTIPPNDRTIISIQSRIFAENAVTGILQPSEPLNEENDITLRWMKGPQGYMSMISLINPTNSKRECT